MDVNSFPEPYYENIEFSLPDQSSDVAASAQSGWGTFFGKGPAATDKGGFATRVSIRTDRAITVKFNKSTYPSISIAQADSPFEHENLEIKDIFFSNISGGAANVKIFLHR